MAKSKKSRNNRSNRSKKAKPKKLRASEVERRKKMAARDAKARATAARAEKEYHDYLGWHGLMPRNVPNTSRRANPPLLERQPNTYDLINF